MAVMIGQEVAYLINVFFALLNGLLANWVVLSPVGPPTLTAKGAELINNLNSITNIVFVNGILPFIVEILKGIASF